MTCSANPVLSMQPLFNPSILSDTQLQDEIAKTFLYTGGAAAAGNSVRTTPAVCLQTENVGATNNTMPSEPTKITTSNTNEAVDCDPIPLGKHQLAYDSNTDYPNKPSKKQRIEPPSVTKSSSSLALQQHHEEEIAGIVTIPPSTEGIMTFGDNDVLSGRGGGTNVHPGNRTFRDLINQHRRDYLKAKKNDKPAISRAIVKIIRDAGGRFLKKEKSGLWFEIGDTLAREKTSQALRQRAPEMRRLMFQSEQAEASRTMSQQQGQLQQMLLNGMGRSMLQNNLNMLRAVSGGGDLNCAAATGNLNLLTELQGNIGMADQSFGLRSFGMHKKFQGESEPMILPPQFLKEL